MKQVFENCTDCRLEMNEQRLYRTRVIYKDCFCMQLASLIDALNGKLNFA
jgi:hypothetical protein